MKANVIPAHRLAGRQCYAFVDPKFREAFRVLTGRNSATKEKLDALTTFGIEVSISGDTKASHAASEALASEVK